jgi:MbtH protein
MFDDDEEETLPYLVLVNDEEQHSLWRADLDIPAGWRQVFGPGDKADCLRYVNENWVDIRPLSLRRAIEEAERDRQAKE